jgi:large subunit ribosomal protein L6
MIIKLEGTTLTVERPSEDKLHKSLHGLTRTLINNMVLGVTEGFTKNLEINGVGYRAAKAGKNLNLSLGFSHPVIVEPPDGITLDAPAANRIIISGINKEAVGAMAAKIRGYREPEPYKGKGIKYEGEHVRRKVGKAGAKGKK